MAATYVGLALLSAAALAFEITLTRLFSVSQWYHFAFLAVSVALLGYGASGTALTLVPRWTQPPTARRASVLASLFTVSVVGAGLSINHLPFDSYRIAWERIQTLYLVLYYLALAAPFFSAGLVTGLLLAAHAGHAPRLYGASLLGSALGGLVPVAVLPLLGEGTILIIAALGLLAAFAFQSPIAKWRWALLVMAVSGLLLFLAISLPAPFQLRLSPYKALSQVLRFPDSELIWQRWNAFSRVDRVSSSTIRSAPGLSLNYSGRLPAQDGLFVDGDGPSPVLVDVTSDQASDLRAFTGYLPSSLPYQLRPGAHVLLLESRGGLDLWVALGQGAASVVAVEGNPLLVHAAAELYRDERVDVVIEEGRSYARRSSDAFDLVHLALSDGYRPVTSGAYSLGERYDLTVEAFEDYLARLRPGGLLVVERWLQLPPSETLRAGATIVQAMQRAGVKDPAAQMAVLRDWQVGLILVKKGPFTGEELAAIRGFSQKLGLDLVALPGLTEAEANQFNVLEEPVYYRAFRQLFDEPESFAAAQVYDIRPTTDDRPFYFHFFKWGQTGAVLQQLGKTWQPWGGSGYFVLVALLGVALVTSAVLILLPLVFGPGHAFASGRLRGVVLAYFGFLGLGFLFVEIPLMQHFILFLGQPIYAFTTVLAALLLFSGLGSFAATRLSPRRVLPFLSAAILLYPLGLPLLYQGLLGAPLAVRLIATMISLAPLGFLMGIPFPGGLAWLRESAPDMVPWAWGINGCSSVLASVLAAIIALAAGFSWVLVASSVAYASAWLVLRWVQN